MNKNKSARLLMIASVLMLIAAITTICLKIFGNAEVYHTAYIFFMVSALLFIAAINIKKSGDK